MLDQNSVGSRYQLHDVLGAGGMGVVYRATDRLTRQSVALKLLAVPTELLDFMSRTDSEELRVSLAREFQFLASLRHPNIVSVLDYGFDMSGQPYLALELLQDAQTITEASANRSVSERVQFLLQVLQALAYLHRRGIVHRDLKPSNILVVGEQVKLLDFGLSETQGQQATIRGTPAYFAPEILEGDPISEASDLYAVGVVAYESFAGHPLFAARDWESLRKAILTEWPDMARLALPAPISHVIEKLLAKRVSERYASASEALSALAEAANSSVEETPAIRASFLQAARFIGREAELNMLLMALKEAHSRHGSLWLVGGESGVGKSRLLEELRINAMVGGFLVLQGQAYENGLPYHIWREPLRKLILGVDVSPADSGILKLLLPDIDLLLEHPVDTLRQPDSAEIGRYLSSTVISLFRHQTQPMLLLLEDLHWANKESLTLLTKLQQSIQDVPLTIVGSYRDDESPTLPEVLQPEHLIKLDRLNPQEVKKLSEAMLGEAGIRQQVQELLESETEGNAFFLVEVVRALAEQAGQLDRIGSVTLPTQVFTGGIRRVIQRRLDHLPSSAYPLLKLAAALGKQLDLSVLQAVQPPGKIEDWLLICSDAAVLRVQDDHWHFAHDKLREGILSEVEPTELVLLHRTAAEAIETTYPGSREFASALAFHWQMAGNGRKEYQYSVLAGEHAFQLSAYQEAIRHFERARALMDSEHVPATSLQRAVLGTFLGRIQMMLSNYPTAARLLEDSLKWATDANEQDKQADALWSLGYNALYGGEYVTAMKYLENSFELYQQGGNLYGMADALRGLARIENAQGAYSSAQARLERSLTLGRESGSDWHVARVLADLGGVKAMQGDYESATHDMEASLTLYRKSGDRAGIINALLYLGQLFLFQRLFSQATQSFQESMSIAREIGDQRASADALNNLGYVELAQKNYPVAKHYFEQGMPIFISVGFQWGIANSHLNLGHVETALDNLDRAIAHYQSALTQAQILGAVPLLLEIIAGVAKIKANRGQKLQALELVSFAVSHPAVNPDIRAFSEPLLSELESTLSPEAYERVSRAEQGRELEDILARLFDDGSAMDV